MSLGYSQHVAPFEFSHKVLDEAAINSFAEDVYGRIAKSAQSSATISIVEFCEIGIHGASSLRAAVRLALHNQAAAFSEAMGFLFALESFYDRDSWQELAYSKHNWAQDYAETEARVFEINIDISNLQTMEMDMSNATSAMSERNQLVRDTLFPGAFAEHG